jgi:hypothetical protein
MPPKTKSLGFSPEPVENHYLTTKSIVSSMDDSEKAEKAKAKWTGTSTIEWRVV